MISTTTTQAAVPGQSSSGGSETQNYCYDEENRLVWAGNSGTQPGAGIGVCGSSTLANSLQGAGYGTSFAYTHLGQLWQGPLNGTGAQQQYLYCDSSHPHQVTGLYPLGTTCATKGGATATYSAGYDAWGNLTSRSYNHATATLSYDVLDELVQWNAGSTSQEWYAYDNASGRVLKCSTTGSGTSLTVYAFGNQEHAYNASGVSTGNTYYYSLAGRLIGKFDGGSNTQFFLTDALGSVLSTFKDVANTAAVLGNQAYGPYGNSQYHSGSLGTAKGFTGQYQDATGLDYYNARFYDPVVGHFVSADTVVSNGQGADPYNYGGGNPETLNDPSGHHPCADDGCSVPSGYFANGGMTNGGWADNPPQLGGGNSNGGGHNYCIGFNCYNSVGQWLYSTYHPPIVRSVVSCAQNPTCLTNFKNSHAQADQSRQQQEANIHAEEVASFFLNVLGGDPENTGEDQKEYIDQLNELNNEQQQEQQDLADTFTVQCSFTPQTEVTVDHSQKEIGTLQPGEKVLAYNPKTHKMELQPILHVWITKDNDLVDLTITSTTPVQAGKLEKQTSEVVHTNQKHPFFTTEKGFVPVSDLHVGMHVLQADGGVGVITSWNVVPGTKVMYNLEVAQDHTFTVGANQWIVHNDCGSTWQFNDHILDRHVGLDNLVASVKAVTGDIYGKGGTLGVWNSANSGEGFINNLMAQARNGSWHPTGPKNAYMAINIKSANIPGRVVSATGTSTSAIGVRIVVENFGTPNESLITAYPIGSSYFP